MFWFFSFFFFALKFSKSLKYLKPTAQFSLFWHSWRFIHLISFCWFFTKFELPPLQCDLPRVVAEKTAMDIWYGQTRSWHRIRTKMNLTIWYAKTKHLKSSSWENCDENFQRTDRQTHKAKPVYPPLLPRGGIMTQN